MQDAFPNSRIIPLRLLHRQKAAFRYDGKESPFWIKILIISAISFAPLYALKELIMQNSAIIQQTAGTAFDMWQKLAFTFVLVASFVLLYQREKFSKAVSSLRFYGK